MKFIGARLSRAEWVPGDGAKGAGALWGPQKSSGPSAPPETGAGDHVPAGIRAQDHDEGRLRHLGHARDALLECSGTRTPGWWGGGGGSADVEPPAEAFWGAAPQVGSRSSSHTHRQKKKIYIKKNPQPRRRAGAQGSQPRLGFITQRLAQPGALR